jgi:hypothetical protein
LLPDIDALLAYACEKPVGNDRASYKFSPYGLYHPQDGGVSRAFLHGAIMAMMLMTIAAHIIR